MVVRAGVMAADAVRRSAQRTFDAYAVFGISVEAVIDQTVLDACRNERIFGYRQIRLSTLAIDVAGIIELEVLPGPVESYSDVLTSA